ncbi:MAG TPA: DUF4199 domain-containing protein [Steroidobacteraceae bacterium]|nr:DUF4199 domain-containing protein [Steroidobacteraceae bacterium]
MIGTILRYGLIAGVIVAAPMLWQMLTWKQGSGNPLGGMLVGYLTMLIALTAVFLGIKHYRDKVLGGAIRFLPAFGLGLGISVVACVLYVAAWEISMAYSDFDFMAWYSHYIIEAAKTQDASPEAMAKAVAQAKEFEAAYANPMMRIAYTFIEMFPVGVLVSLISALVLRKSRVLPAHAA